MLTYELASVVVLGFGCKAAIRSSTNFHKSKPAGLGSPNPVPEKADIPTYCFISYILHIVFMVSMGNSDGSNLLL
jgi:hypothetical protein